MHIDQAQSRTVAFLVSHKKLYQKIHTYYQYPYSSYDWLIILSFFQMGFFAEEMVTPKECNATLCFLIRPLAHFTPEIRFLFSGGVEMESWRRMG